MSRLLILALILLLLFGRKRLGDIGKGLGEGIRNFKKSVGDKPDAPLPVQPEPSRAAEPPLQLTAGSKPEREDDEPV